MSEQQSSLEKEVSQTKKLNMEQASQIVQIRLELSHKERDLEQLREVINEMEQDMN